MPDFDPATLTAYGLPGLFALAFLAGSVLPLPSEALMVALLVGGTHPLLTVIVALIGNLLGAASLFWVGRRLLLGRRGRIVDWVSTMTRSDPARFERCLEWMRRWGSPALLFTWLPVVGDLMVLASGAVGIRVVPFVVFAGIGKAVRFAVVAVAALAAVRAI